MWLTLATFVGYAIVYTVLLKPATPQNIVIGGASGAMPPVLGWAAVTGDVAPEALLLFLIIFVWTPPHFWSLALYRAQDYAKAGLPMLPVTHGRALHAADDRALHRRAGRRDAAAVRDPDERLPLPRRRARAGRRCSSSTRCSSTATTATSWRARRSSTRSSTSPRCSRRCWSTTTGADASGPGARRLRCCWSIRRACCSRACGRLRAPEVHGPPTSPAPRTAAISR